MQKILIVEDDKTLSNGIVLSLQTEKIQISQCYDIKNARENLYTNDFDLITI